MLIRKVFKIKPTNKKKEGCAKTTSTPNCNTRETGTTSDSPHVSRSSSPIIISVESLEELENSFLNQFEQHHAEIKKCPARAPHCPSQSPQCPEQQPTCSSMSPQCPPQPPNCPSLQPTCSSQRPKSPSSEPLYPSIPSPCPAQPPVCPSQQPSCSSQLPPFPSQPRPIQTSVSPRDSSPANNNPSQLKSKLCDIFLGMQSTENSQCPANNDAGSPSASFLEELANSFELPRPPLAKCAVKPPQMPCVDSSKSPKASICPQSPFPSSRSSQTSPSCGPAPCPAMPKSPCTRDSCLVIKSPAGHTPCEPFQATCGLETCSSFKKGSQTCPLLSSKGTCPALGHPCASSTPICPGSRPCSPKPCLKEQSFVASTLKDFVSKIASFASRATDYISDDGSHTCRKEKCRTGRRSVQFRPPCADARGVQQLYFNDDLNKSEVSLECDLCTNEECQEPTAPCVTVIAHDDSEQECPSVRNLEESGAGSSLGGSGSGHCDAEVRAQHYHKKLLATLQILANKEETVRVQADSLAVAEQRIATLTKRAAQTKLELERNAQEIRALRSTASPSITVHKSDVSVETAPVSPEVEAQKKMVITLRDNLAAIEELYRESFYETAKQEELIEKLRKTYLDVRLMEREKADQVGRLQTVVNSQRWSLEQCQDVAVEVENLKMEISNFLNNSNNDSGMWEESLAGEVGEDLQDIMQQLLVLRDILKDDCSCGLKEENKKLREKNQLLECQLRECRQRTIDMEQCVMERDEAIKRYRKSMDENQDQMQCLNQELAVLRNSQEERSCEVECLKVKLQQIEEALEEKTTELEEMQQQCQDQENSIKELRHELERADKVIKENSAVRSEVQFLSQQVSSWRQQLAEAEERARRQNDELIRARIHIRTIDCYYREKAEKAAELQDQLEDAQARGAELCAEARRVVCAVRQWVRKMKNTHSEQEEKIKEHEATIASLRHALEGPCGSRFRDPCSGFTALLDTTFVGPRSPPRKPISTTNKSEATERSPRVGFTSKEKGRCSCPQGPPSATPTRRVVERSSSSSPPAPPQRRILRKKPCEKPPSILRCLAHSAREVEVQIPVRAEAAVSPYSSGCDQLEAPPPRPRSSRTILPTPEDIFQRMEQLSDALDDVQRRQARNKR